MKMNTPLFVLLIPPAIYANNLKKTLANETMKKIDITCRHEGAVKVNCTGRDSTTKCICSHKNLYKEAFTHFCEEKYDIPDHLAREEREYTEWRCNRNHTDDELWFDPLLEVEPIDSEAEVDIVGVILGVIFGVMVVVVIGLWCFWLRIKKQRKEAKDLVARLKASSEDIEMNGMSSEILGREYFATIGTREESPWNVQAELAPARTENEEEAGR
jgi:hypothetical protein